MAKRKQAERPRPNKNSDGQDKKPAPHPTMHGERNVSTPPPREAPAPPGAPLPGHTNPLTHPAHPGMQPPQAPQAGLQMQERIQFKDLPPTGQAQSMAAMGINPNQPAEQIQGNLDSAIAQGPSQGPIPNSLEGPGVPPDIKNFPDDMAHLQALMAQGLGPGSSPQEHDLALNARALTRAREAFASAQDDPIDAPTAGAGPQSQGLPPQLGPPPGGPTGPPAGGPPLTPDGQIPPGLIEEMLRRRRAGAR